MYHEAARMNLSEVSGDRAIRDFLLAVATVDPIYSNSRRELRHTIDDQNSEFAPGVTIRQRTIDEEIERFRNQIRLENTTSAVKDTRSAFATDTEKPTYKNATVDKLPRCLCGERMWYADCPYLVPSKAPAG